MLPFRQTLLFLLFATLSGAAFVGCDSNEGDDLPGVEETIIVGTNVPDDFLQTGMFELAAIPTDDGDNPILSSNVQAEVKIDSVNGLSIDDIIASALVGQVNQPSDLPLAAAVVLDNSGSMSSTDRSRIRVSGAKRFVNTLDNQNVDFEAAVFFYPGSSADFSVTRLAQDYTDNLDSLEAAIEEASAGGGTPTHRSVLDVLDYSETVRPTAQYNRAVVLLSDGQSADPNLLNEVCALADSLASPIYTIGLGPASAPSSFARDEMENLANCDNYLVQGAFAALSEDDSDEADAIYSNIARATGQGNLSIDVQITQGLDMLNPGDRVVATLTLSSEEGSASASFDFVARGSSGGNRPAPPASQGLVD